MRNRVASSSLAMLREKFHSFLLTAFVFSLSFDACLAKCSSSCGDIRNISFPFRLNSDPRECGLNERTELVCENNITLLYLGSSKYHVLNISYDNQTIRLVDANLDRNNCSIEHLNNPLEDEIFDPYSFYYFSPYYSLKFISCPMPLNSSVYVDVSPCITNSSSQRKYFYAVQPLHYSDIPLHCKIEATVPTHFTNITGISVFDIYRSLLSGFDLPFFTFYRDKFPFLFSIIISLLEFLYTHRRTIIKFAIIATGGFFLGRSLLGIICLIAIVKYKYRRRHLSFDDTIEEFLETQNNFMPIRYTYSQIKRMTKGFNDKLGQGGFGSVYKGKLRSGRLVAIKVIGKSKANGQDFINEVATIGRIHHVNVVSLIGFCVEGSKQALVYEFMPNGSLDKFIFSDRENHVPLSWERTYDIAQGVARGIEYLHRGCDMQILHFDIKPHNILLDKNFNPKISDFGLAKLYSVDDSIVSLTAARGTPGYIAPELFYKNIGGISYKADVYSFGMLLMEMEGKRKNLTTQVEQASQIYFPSWIYDRFNEGKDVEFGDATEEEKVIVRKMVIVAFWCIQLKPINRPSMKKVLEMLQGAVEILQIPPKPFSSPQEMSG